MYIAIEGVIGVGKTTLAHILANEMGVNLRHTSGPVLERAGDVGEAREMIHQFHTDRIYAGGDVATNWMKSNPKRS